MYTVCVCTQQYDIFCTVQDSWLLIRQNSYDYSTTFVPRISTHYGTFYWIKSSRCWHPHNGSWLTEHAMIVPNKKKKKTKRKTKTRKTNNVHHQMIHLHHHLLTMSINHHCPCHLVDPMQTTTGTNHRAIAGRSCRLKFAITTQIVFWIFVACFCLHLVLAMTKMNYVH